MQASNKCYDLIRRFEGIILHAYLCPKGVLTIGVGHTGSDVKEGMVITEKEAENLLKKDLNKFASKITYSLEQDHITVNQNQVDALCSFAYNLGFSAFIFSTLYKKLKQGDYEGASDEFLKWVYITKTVNGERVKIRLKGLETRRNAERDLFLS
jgi:lysozyme